jgi:hypothetical protein
VYDVLLPNSLTNRFALPIFLFALDLSYHAYSIGFTQQMISSIKASLGSLPPNTRVGLIGYSDRIMFFDLQNRRVSVLSDLTELVFDIRLCNACPTIANGKDALVTALDSFLEHAPLDQAAGNCLGSLFLFAERVLCRNGGVLFAGVTELPREGPSKLAKRALADELMLMLPSDGSGRCYRDGATRLNRSGVSTHLFAVGPEYLNLACLGIPSGLSSGSCNYYPVFDDDARQRLHTDIFARMTEQYDLDAIVQICGSKGIKVTRPLTNCLLSSNGNLWLGAVGPRTVIVHEFCIVAPIVSADGVLQWQYRFTDKENRRVMRVFSFGLQISSDPRAVLASVDEGALATLVTRRAVATILKEGTIAAVATVKKDVESVLGSGARFGVLYQFMHALLSLDLFRPTLGYDWLMAEMICWRSLSIVDTLLSLYPRMVCIDGGCVIVPLTGSSFAAGHCFLLHMVSRIIIWVGAAAPPEWIRDAFGVGSVQEIPPDVPTLDGPANRDLNAAIQECWTISRRYLPVTLITQGDPREAIFAQLLVEDSAVAGAVFSEWRKQVMRIVV